MALLVKGVRWYGAKFIYPETCIGSLKNNNKVTDPIFQAVEKIKVGKNILDRF
jgi:hypothetical protein